MVIGSIWQKEKNGKVFYSGVIQSPFIPEGEMHFAIFQNDKKDKTNQPDFNIVWSKNKNNDNDIPM
jgi:uncharacterized protein (DUF736 family)